MFDRSEIVVGLCVTVFLFSPLITLLTFGLLAYFWSLPWTLLISSMYLIWMYIDRRTDSHGGRWSPRFRQLSIWSNFVDYFPMKLIKTADLDPNRNYIFGYHPHGVLSLGSVGNFVSDATGFSRLFPGLRSHLMLLRLQFLFPFTRELFLNCGACCVSRSSCEHLLNGSSGHGNALVIVIGGIKEMKLAKEKTMILYLKARKGFIQLASKYGASLVPVISFGENELYRSYPGGITWGRRIFGYLPIRRPIFTVVGKAIDVECGSDVDEVHRRYIQSVEDLFNNHRVQFGCEHLQLEMI